MSRIHRLRCQKKRKKRKKKKKKKKGNTLLTTKGKDITIISNSTSDFVFEKKRYLLRNKTKNDCAVV